MTLVSDPGFEIEGPDDSDDEAAENEAAENETDDAAEANSDDAAEANSDDAADDEEAADDAADDEATADDKEAADNAAEDAEEPAARPSAAQIVDEALAEPIEADDPDPEPDEAEPAQAEARDEPTAAAPMPTPQPAPVATAVAPATSTSWSTRQLTAVAQRVLAVFVVLGLIGYGIGALRGNSNVARAEFVYTLDESVPDSFLREDRRLLTQVVTFKSDAVLTPVAERFDLSVDELRSKIDVETLNLSEVLRLDVSDSDPDQAVAINRAVLDQYLTVIADATPAGNGEELAERRAEVAADLAEADAARLALLRAGEQDAALEVRQESLRRRINLENEQINRLQGSLDDALIQALPRARQDSLAAELENAADELADLEAELVEVGAERAALETATTAEPALLREIERLEAKLDTIDDELAERELGPLVASPIRELSEPIVLFRSLHIFGLQGMAIGLLAAVPLAALVAYRTRKRQLWFN